MAVPAGADADGAGRRIRKTVAETTHDFYYNEGYQAVEVQQDGDADPLEQWVYDQRYVDAPVVRFFDGNTDGDLADAGDNILYATADANFSITGLVDPSTGEEVQRAIYTPYGERTILTINWQPTTDSYSWLPGHQGLRHDAESGLVYNRARYLHTSLGTFIIRDIIMYGDGMSLYQYAKGKPFEGVDPEGKYYWKLFTTGYAIGKACIAAYELKVCLACLREWGDDIEWRYAHDTQERADLHRQNVLNTSPCGKICNDAGKDGIAAITAWFFRYAKFRMPE